MRITVLTIFCAAFVTVSSAQAVYTPERNSAERAAILNALRVPVERDLKQKIVFVVGRISVQMGWAFVSGEPQTATGTRPNLKGTAWEAMPDLFDNNFFGLLRKQRGKWRVVIHALGCTDVCYLDWWQTHKAPRDIFGLPEGIR